MMQEQMQLKLPPKPPNWKEVHDVTTDLQILNLELQRKLYMDDSDSSTICTTESEISDVDTADASNTTTDVTTDDSDAVSDFEMEQDEWLELQKQLIQKQFADLNKSLLTAELIATLQENRVNETESHDCCGGCGCGCVHSDEDDFGWNDFLQEEEERRFYLLGEWLTFDHDQLIHFVSARSELPGELQTKLAKWVLDFPEYTRPPGRPLPLSTTFYDLPYDFYEPMWMEYHAETVQMVLEEVLRNLAGCVRSNAGFDEPALCSLTSAPVQHDSLVSDEHFV